MTLAEKARQFNILKEEKESLAEAAKEAGKRLQALEDELIADMLDQEMPKFTSDGFAFSVSTKTFYSILAADRDEGFAGLRELGLGGLIQEKLDDRQLTKTLTEIADGNGGELPQEYEGLPLNIYEKNALSRRKDAKKK